MTNPDPDRALADVEAAFSLDEQWRATWTDWPQSAPPNGAMTDVDRGRLLGWLRTLAAAVRRLQAENKRLSDFVTGRVMASPDREYYDRAEKAEAALAFCAGRHGSRADSRERHGPVLRNGGDMAVDRTTGEMSSDTFLQTLKELRQGAAVTDLSEVLAELVTAVRATGRCRCRWFRARNRTASEQRCEAARRG